MQKYYIMGINQLLWNIALNLQPIQEKILPIIFHAVRSTKHLVDRVSADYIDYYMQGSGKSDKYGFFWHLPVMYPMRLDVFLTFSQNLRI